VEVAGMEEGDEGRGRVRGHARTEEAEGQRRVEGWRDCRALFSRGPGFSHTSSHAFTPHPSPTTVSSLPSYALWVGLRVCAGLCGTAEGCGAEIGVWD